MLRIALLATAALLAAPAAAQGFYVGGHIGQATVDDACEGLSSCDDSDTAWRILGGYQVNPNLAIEAAYTDFGEINARDTVLGLPARVNVESSAIELVAVGMLPLSDRFSAYAKGGVYRAETDGAVRVSGLGSDSFSESNTDITFGVGASFSVTDNASVRAEWQRYSDVGGGDIGEADVDVLSVGALFRF